MREHRPPRPAADAAADAVLIPILRRDHDRGQTIVTLELRALHLERREIFSTAVSYTVTP